MENEHDVLNPQHVVMHRRCENAIDDVNSCIHNLKWMQTKQMTMVAVQPTRKSKKKKKRCKIDGENVEKKSRFATAFTSFQRYWKMK